MAKRFKTKDPHYRREAKKYDFPIPSREYILKLLEERGKPVKAKELFSILEMTSEDETFAIKNRLRAMLRDGQLHMDRRGRYGVTDKLNLIRGRVQGHPDGFGFLIPDDGEEDLFISPKQMRNLLDGDIVLVREISTRRGGQREAIVHELLERTCNQVIGMLIIINGVAYIEPENKRIAQTIHVPNKKLSGAKDGQIVVVELSPPTERGGQLMGAVVEIVGEHLAPGMEIDIALRAHGIPHQWSKKVKQEIKRFNKKQDLTDRIDCRDKAFVTIDGADAKDFDDAVYCEARKSGGWRLWVAIADVSHYVKPGSAIDEEASDRGNSVYFPGQVVPMLPEVLSNELCSLLPVADRYTLVCEMTISAQGKLTRAQFYQGIIHSRARLTYHTVSQIIETRDDAVRAEHAELTPHLDELYQLYQVLVQARKTRGAMDFDSVETRINFDENRKIESIEPVIRNDAHRVIEECMLIANVATAKFLEKNNIPALYRVHEPPKADRVTELREFLGRIGLSLGGGKVPKTLDYAKLLAQSKKHPDCHLVQMVVLRSLCQAIYSPDNHGHFGLAYPAYAHFTSPIRRYPDLVVHRAIKYALKVPGYEDYPYTKKMMTTMGSHLSMTERRADDATRDVVLWLKCEYMLEHLGSVFDGVISSVVHFGLFIELEDVYVDGLLHITSLPEDYYNFDQVMHTLTGERSGRTYRLGDRIRVQVARVDLNERKIDFELV